MPELPEVETVCRLMRKVLEGNEIRKVFVAEDPIVLSNTPPKEIESALLGNTVTGVGRKGKFWWLELNQHPFVFGHLGMSGWIRDMSGETIRLLSHGRAPLDDENGLPKYLKLLIEVDGGRQIAMTDGRRLGRLWLSPSPEVDERVQRLGRDAYCDLPESGELVAMFQRRKVSIKAVLLDQSVLAGIGNWVADEVLYQAKIAPGRLSSGLNSKEVSELHRVIRSVINLAVNVGADSEKYPESWLFTSRWGGKKGKDSIGGRAIVRETIAGRTTAWVPEVQV